MNSELRNDRGRPYDGQPHTDLGERGKTLVDGLTMRDVWDCIIMGMIASTGESEWGDKVRDGTWAPSDVYDLPWDRMDPIACVQNAMCNVEKMMDIYPNVPELILGGDAAKTERGVK